MEVFDYDDELSFLCPSFTDIKEILKHVKYMQTNITY